MIVRAHPKLLHAEALAEPMIDADAFWKHRYRSITNLERHLHTNGTRVVKIFLHLSKDEQRKRFLDRIDEPWTSSAFPGPPSIAGMTGINQAAPQHWGITGRSPAGCGTGFRTTSATGS